ncbi:MAG: hypothetical protein COC12_02800 [Rhodobacteraceae bacterium]|nr:MAG: hypothetical protein COC12_02800 [Paracoccaceae bacterium]
MSEQSTISLLQYDLSLERLQLLPEDHQAVISVLSYAVSEVNALQRVFLAQELKLTGTDAINSAIKIQYFVILRAWSSKIYEALKFMQDLLWSNKPTTKDPVLLKLADGLADEFQALRAGGGFEVSRIVRNEAANHYSFSAALKNLSHIRKEADCNFYTHEYGGNDFFPLGEEVMFQARLERKWTNFGRKEEKDSRFKEWLDWNLQATEWLGKTHAGFCNQLVFIPSRNNEMREVVYDVPTDLVGHPPNKKTPVFFDKPASGATMK